MQAPVDTTEARSAARLLAIAFSLLLHAALVWLVLQIVLGTATPPPPVAVTLVHEPAPPPRPAPVLPEPAPRPLPIVRPVVRPVVQSPPPAPVPRRQAAPRPVVTIRPNRAAQRRAPVVRPTARATPSGPPVMHFGAAGADAGLGLDLGTPSGGGGSGHGSIDAFDEAVHRRIQSMKSYPPGLPYMPMECIVEYRVSVDPDGNMIDYHLTGCGNPFLDSATRAAIMKAAPFPRPPDFGGKRYEVYGNLIYLRH